MASILLFAPGVAWESRVNDVVHKVTVPAANCRPQKSVVDQSVGPISSECISRDTCPPFVKNYLKWSGGFTIYETVAGIGLGCLIGQASVSFTRRDALTDAGNNMVADDMVSNILSLLTRLNTAGAWIDPAYFGANSSIARVCP